MLAPESLRPGFSPVEADRRRTVRLAVIAVVAALLAVAVPVTLAVVAAQDDDAAPAATALTRPDPSRVPAANDGAVPGPGATAAATADPAPPAPSGAADPADPVAPVVAVAAEPTVASPTVASPAEPAGPVTAAPAPESAAPSAAAANWMEALRPQVDPEGLATWVFQARGAWGASDGHTVYIDPNVPADKRWSVMVHEYGHVLQVHRYGSLDATAAAMNAIVGAGPMDKGPTESNADCIAERLGATWTDYGCVDALRPAATALVADDQSRIAAARAARP